MINCIVAVEQNQGIGHFGSMPWPFLKEDLLNFKKLTTDQIVIMGSKTWESLPKKPLPNRINVVISRFNLYPSDFTFHTVDYALNHIIHNFPEKEIFIIGGQVIYDHSMHLIDKFYITEINAHFPCDKFFNLKYVQKKFKNVKILGEYKDPIEFTIKEYTK